MINGRLYRAIAVVMLVAAVAACGRGDPASFIASARSYMAKSDYPAAIIELKNALKGAPDNAEARFLLAKALLESGDVVAAETEARKALDLKYPPDDAYPVLARSLMRQGEHKKLLADVDDGKLTSPDARAEVLTARGVAYLGLGQNKEALQAIERALAAQPKSVNARVARAVIAATEGDATEVGLRGRERPPVEDSPIGREAREPHVRARARIHEADFLIRGGDPHEPHLVARQVQRTAGDDVRVACAVRARGEVQEAVPPAGEFPRAVPHADAAGRSEVVAVARLGHLHQRTRSSSSR